MAESVEGTARDLTRIRYVTENYHALQGLTYLPTDGVLLLIGILGTLGVKTDSVVYYLALIPAAVASVVFSYRSVGYYERRFGRFTQRRRRMSLQEKLFLSGTLFLVAVFWGIRDRLDEPVLGASIGLFTGAGMLFFWWLRRHGLAIHWPVLGALVTGAGLLSLSGALFEEPSLMLAVSSFAFAAGHLLDHLLLVRTFRSVPGGAYDASH